MPPIETVDLVDDAVLWSRTGRDDQGEDTFASPVAVKVRWVPSTTIVTTAEGDTVQLVVRAGVDQDVPDNSVMWLGSYSSKPASGSKVSGLLQVRSKQTARDTKGRDPRYEVGLTFYKRNTP